MNYVHKNLNALIYVVSVYSPTSFLRNMEVDFNDS